MKCRYNPLTSKQQKAMDEEIHRQFQKLIGIYNTEATIQLLYLLHFEYGFGQERLKRFVQKFSAMQNETTDYYGLEETDVAWLAKKKLTDAGLDLDYILKGDKE